MPKMRVWLFQVLKGPVDYQFGGCLARCIGYCTYQVVCLNIGYSGSYTRRVLLYIKVRVLVHQLVKEGIENVRG